MTRVVHYLVAQSTICYTQSENLPHKQRKLFPINHLLRPLPSPTLFFIPVSLNVCLPRSITHKQRKLLPTNHLLYPLPSPTLFFIPVSLNICLPRSITHKQRKLLPTDHLLRPFPSPTHATVVVFIPVSLNFCLPHSTMSNWTTIFASDILHCITMLAKAYSLPLQMKPNEKHSHI